MIKVEKIDTESRKQVKQFIQFPFKLYEQCPQWVPPIIADVKVMLNKQKHPFYEHSDADFFLAYEGGEVVGRIAALENKSYNQAHEKKDASFYLFESIDSQEVADALFQTVVDWASKRGLTKIIGPKGFSVFDGYGVLVEGFEYRQMMTMMNYNYPYYSKLIENNGFEKEVDFVSCRVSPNNFKMPEKVHEIARRIKERGTFEVKEFSSKRELKKWADRIGKTYNQTFVNNWEYYPLTEKEIKFILDNVLMVADPKLIKIITYNENVVGFLFAFPDVSAALQRHKGRLTPWAIIDMLREMKRTNWVAFNGGGVLPKYHGRGGNALLYVEMEKTIRDYNFEYGEFTQIAETAVQMRKDLVNLNGEEFKNHRVFRKSI